MDVILQPRTHDVVRRTKSQGFSNLARLMPATHTEPTLDELRRQAINELNNFLYEQVIVAPSADDLVYVIDDLLDDVTYSKLRRRLGSLLSSQAVDSSIDSLPSLDFLKVLIQPKDTELVVLIDHGYRLMKAHIVAWLQFLAIAIQLENKSDVPLASPATPMEFVRDASLPLEWRKAMLAYEQSSVSLDVLMALAVPSDKVDRGPIERWMVEYLLRTWVMGTQAHLVWLAGFPGIDRPDALLVGTSEIKDLLQQPFASHKSEEAGYQERLKAARSAGGWYPTPEPDDEH